MTRITSFGRKRTYIEAGFDPEPSEAVVVPEPKATGRKPLPSQAEALEVAEEAASAIPNGAPVPRKHPKRHRPNKKKKFEGEESSVVQGEVDATTPVTKPKSQPQPKKQKKSLKKRRDSKISPQEQRRLKRIEERLAGTTCFACREKGHAAKDCPKAATLVPEGDEGDVEANPQLRKAVGICYRCGSSKHTLSRCRKPPNPEDPFPFASCFVCSGKGHLAGACPKNKERGVYPNGGACKICGDTSHLAKDCQIRRNVGTGRDAGADEDDFMILARKTKVVEREEQKEERFKRLQEVAEHAPARVFNGAPRPQASVAKPVKKVVVF
ncbi:zinc knuckle family protein [Coprinopsis sp. MPI-PUGE-AT-0042]|nr:zinc knuckle family protein [Coprinopsis sp. MPI-PUGE-AT-0042]